MTSVCREAPQFLFEFWRPAQGVSWPASDSAQDFNGSSHDSFWWLGTGNQLIGFFYQFFLSFFINLVINCLSVFFINLKFVAFWIINFPSAIRSPNASAQDFIGLRVLLSFSHQKAQCSVQDLPMAGGFFFPS